MSTFGLSIIIPSRNEQFLKPTVGDLFAKARGEIEVIVILDGYWDDPHPSAKIVHRGKAQGMRQGINAGVALAKFDHVMKIDGHCMVSEGYDVELVRHCEPNWVCVPTRKRLDAENWCVQEVGKPDINYMYLSYPDNPLDFGGASLHGREWREKNADQTLDEEKLVDLMTFQGSCWMMHRDYFYELELMDHDSYGSFWNEAQEIGLKAWLSGGRVVRNKHAWYAHLHKGKKYGRGYFLANSTTKQGADYTKRWLTFQSAWSKQTLPLSWLIEKFSPLPEWSDERISKLKETECQ